MNSPVLNIFDPVNAAALCGASAAAYLDCAGDAFVVSRLTDTHVRITDEGKDLVVAFRGTADVRNWLTDLDCGWGLENGFHVHRGFARALDSVEAEVRAEIVSRGEEGRRIWLTGHSLGGALAMLFAWRLWNGCRNGDPPYEAPLEQIASSPRPSPPQVCGGEGDGMPRTRSYAQHANSSGQSLPLLRQQVEERAGERGLSSRTEVHGEGTDRTRSLVEWLSSSRTPLSGSLPELRGEREDFAARLAGVYTFGQPRIGDSTFRDCYNFSGLMGRTFRIVHADDIVPRVPWLLGAYRHAGHEVFWPEVRSQKSEVRISDSWILDSGFFAKLPWDLRNAWREFLHGKVALLADHHVSTYLDLFHASLIHPAQRICL